MAEFIQGAADAMNGTDLVEGAGSGSPEGTPSAPAQLPEWLTGIEDEELKGSKYLQNFKDVRDLAKSALEGKRTLSKKLLNLPGADASDEEWNQVLTQLGRPESPDQYDLKVKLGEQEVDLAQSNPAMADLLRNVAYAMGVPQGRVAKGLQAIAEWESQSPGRNLKQLQEIWGKDYKQNGMVVNSMINRLPEALQQKVVQTFGLNNPVLAEVLLHYGRETGEDRRPSGKDTRPAQGGDTLDSVRQQMQAIYRDPVLGPAYFNPINPHHKEAADKLNVLMKKEADLLTGVKIHGK